MTMPSHASPTWLQRFLLPGLAFQAVMIGGGYATGRELVEFFLQDSPWTGLLGLLTACALFSAICMVTFRFAQLTASYDYRTFFSNLLGRGWVAFEVLLVALMLLILSVAAAACGEIATLTFGVPKNAGVAVFIVIVITVTLAGSSAVNRMFKYWSFLLYAVYATFLLVCLTRFGDPIGDAFGHVQIESSWLRAGASYAGYNVVTAVLVLHTLRYALRPRDTLIAGALCGPLAMLPAIAFFLPAAAFAEEVRSTALPSDLLLGMIGWPLLQWLYQITIFGAIVETGTGLLHAVNERVDGVARGLGRPLTPLMRGLIAATVLLIALSAAQRFGLVGLIAEGYGTLTWFALILYAVPVLTWGAWRIWGPGQKRSQTA